MAKVMVVDKNQKRGASTERILRANGHESRCISSSVPNSKEFKFEWPDIVLLADHPAPKSFNVIYRDSGGCPSKDDTYFFLELARHLIRGIAIEFPFPLR